MLEKGLSIGMKSDPEYRARMLTGCWLSEWATGWLTDRGNRFLHVPPPLVILTVRRCTFYVDLQNSGVIKLLLPFLRHSSTQFQSGDSPLQIGDQGRLIILPS